MRVIGTAGHVDHGKSALVQALTGTHPDRLKEEREREMTIDLGFAFFNLPDGQELGIVDVPGHRDFIENMLSGVGGIDAVLFVVAADEGIMPQTREHLAILDLLQINGGLIALTKTDLVTDPDWLALVEDEIAAAVSGTVLSKAPIYRVSARTGQGVEDLLSGLVQALEERPERQNLGRPRLPVDRVFSMQGFGTVVTGTLSDGSFDAGREVEIAPTGTTGRIRGIQSNKLKLDNVSPGSRVAVNISGISVDQIDRGNWICYPGDYAPTRRVDVQFRHLPDASQPLKHNIDMKLFIGAAEVMGRVRLLGADQLDPGETGWLQIELRDPIIARRGDRFILRRPSPAETVGGGMIVDPHPKGRHRRFNTAMLGKLAALAGGSPEDVFMDALAGLGITRAAEVRQRSALDVSVTSEIFDGLVDRGEIILLEEDKPVEQSLIASRGVWESQMGQAVSEVQRFHKKYPLRAGIGREELKSRLKLKSSLYQLLLKALVDAGKMREGGRWLALPSHEIVLTPEQSARMDRLMEKLSAEPYATPSVKDVIQEIGEPLLFVLIDSEQVVQVSQEVLFAKGDYDRMLADTRDVIGSKGEITVADFRDHFKTSRKYALAFLEHLDAVGVTVRVGDGRRLKA